MTGLVAVATLFVLAVAGCCLFDTGTHHHHGTGVALCGALAIIATSAPLSVVLALAGMSAGGRAWAATPIALSIPHPPPWR